jgi:hypothetical protein
MNLIEKLSIDEPRLKEHLDVLLVRIQAASLPWIFPRQAQLGLYYVAQHATDKGYKVLVDNLDMIFNF